MTVKNAYLLFEQSGTFKREFLKLGVQAFDFDIDNQFGETDTKIDLFNQIDLAYSDKVSIFTDFEPDDLVIAFFPCTYFCGNNTMFFDGTNKAWQSLTQVERLEKIISRAEERNRYYVTALKLCAIAERMQLRMIIENPYNAHHYWRYNFPYKPAVIDMNRRLSGDYYPKPTQYIFINCTPTGKKSAMMDKGKRYISQISGFERSMISPDYAHNFICDQILNIDSGHRVPTLFD